MGPGWSWGEAGFVLQWCGAQHHPVWVPALSPCPAGAELWKMLQPSGAPSWCLGTSGCCLCRQEEMGAAISHLASLSRDVPRYRDN